MPTAKPVVVGVDFSPCSRSAIARARLFAEASEAPLRVVHTLDRSVVDELAEAIGEDRSKTSAGAKENAAKRLKEFALAASPGITATFVVLDGSPADALIAELVGCGAALLVLGTHGLSGPGPGIGSFASHCIRNAPCDVALIQDGASGKFSIVAVGVDFSKTCERALSSAARIAKADGAKLHLLHVFSPPWKQLHWRAPTPSAPPPFRAQYLDALRARLEKVGEEFAGDVPTTIELVENDSHGRGLADYARRAGADLIVMGKRGKRSLLAQFVLGSTAERMLRELPTSLLAIAPEKA